MKFAITIIAACCFHLSFAQGYQPSAIDWRVQSIDAPNVDSLARLLVEPYRTDLEKARQDVFPHRVHLVLRRLQRFIDAIQDML